MHDDLFAGDHRQHGVSDDGPRQVGDRANLVETVTGEIIRQRKTTLELTPGPLADFFGRPEFKHQDRAFDDASVIPSSCSTSRFTRSSTLPTIGTGIRTRYAGGCCCAWQAETPHRVAADNATRVLGSRDGLLDTYSLPSKPLDHPTPSRAGANTCVARESAFSRQAGRSHRGAPWCGRL